MSGGGIIVRLIDIVLLLLFGFLVISEIEKKSPVSLPQSTATVQNAPEKDELLVLDIMHSEKSSNKINYFIEGEELYLVDFRSVIDKIKRRKNTLETEFKRKLKVRIRSNWNIPIKYTMKIVKFCQSNGVKVGLDVETQMK